MLSISDIQSIFRNIYNARISQFNLVLALPYRQQSHMRFNVPQKITRHGKNAKLLDFRTLLELYIIH